MVKQGKPGLKRVVGIRVSDEEYELLRRDARAEDRTVSSYIRRRLLGPEKIASEQVTQKEKAPTIEYRDGTYQRIGLDAQIAEAEASVALDKGEGGTQTMKPSQIVRTGDPDRRSHAERLADQKEAAARRKQAWGR